MLKIFTAAAAVITAIVLMISYICYRIVFFVPEKNKGRTMPLKGDAYKPHRETMKKMQEEAAALPYEDLYIKSFDGLTLHARYYEKIKGADTEILFHGYRGSADRDLSGAVQRCFAIGRNAILVDQRTSGKSEGNVITFGIKEHRDCLDWVDFAVKHFGSDVNFIISGISMGASTVLMAAGRELPPNVKGVLADCAFTTAEEIIRKCCGDMKLPAALVYPFIKLGAKLYGHFDLGEYSALEGVKNCTLPVIFFHSEQDDFVPSYMSCKLYENCVSPKHLEIIKGAGHGLAYILDSERYLCAISSFFTENGLETTVTNKINE
ncbi:MAG: alpha/beta hydrolase [Oscillospiraceae bacterium]|nr:alpha/beta hydrolase [Oscillospiraceae bacterium]